MKLPFQSILKSPVVARPVAWWHRARQAGAAIAPSLQKLLRRMGADDIDAAWISESIGDKTAYLLAAGTGLGLVVGAFCVATGGLVTVLAGAGIFAASAAVSPIAYGAVKTMRARIAQARAAEAAIDYYAPKKIAFGNPEDLPPERPRFLKSLSEEMAKTHEAVAAADAPANQQAAAVQPKPAA